MKNIRSKKKHNITRRTFALLVVIVLLVVSQSATLVYLAKLRSQIDNAAEVNVLPALIARSEYLRYKDPVIKVSEKRAYIPDARIYLPLTDDMPIFKYDYLKFVGTANLSISLPGAIGFQKTQDHHACDKMIVFSRDKTYDSAGYELVKEIPATKDGFKYIYVHTPETCSIYTDEMYASAKTIATKFVSY